MPPTRAVDRTITIPAGDQTFKTKVTWRGFAVNRGVKVLITNRGRHACELLDVYPDGGGHRLRPGRTVELSVVDGCEDLPLRLRSAGGTELDVAVPRMLAVEKTPDRDAETSLISRVIEKVVWVPA